MKLVDIFATVEPGDNNWAWCNQFKWLENNHWPELKALTRDVVTNGQQTPIHIGSDGRLWDGHHRLWVFYTLRWTDCDAIDDRKTAPHD